jgi:hypothetical protein
MSVSCHERTLAVQPLTTMVTRPPLPCSEDGVTAGDLPLATVGAQDNGPADEVHERATSCPQTAAVVRWRLVRREGDRRDGPIRDDFSLHHLNCGITGTLMRGGGGAATLPALPTPLGSTDIFSNAPRVAAFGRAPPTPPECPIPAGPPPRANEAAGVAKIMNNAIATFTEVFDMG